MKDNIAFYICMVLALLILVGGGVACQYSQDRKEENMCGSGYYWSHTGAFEQPHCIKLP
jgi:hypothetical protein